MKEIYVARVGMCVHGSGSPMHRGGCCWVSGGTPAPASAVGGLWAAAAALLLTNWELKQKHKAQTPLQLFAEASQSRSELLCLGTWDIRLLPPLAPEGMRGSRDG